MDSITDLDVECLNEAGRPWEVVVAGRQLAQLARLHGWGFVVDVQAVRQANLRAENWNNDRNAPLGGDPLNIFSILEHACNGFAVASLGGDALNMSPVDYTHLRAHEN